MLGGADGFLKLIFDTSTLKLLGVHAFGEGATEIVHIGQVRVVDEMWVLLPSSTRLGVKRVPKSDAELRHAQYRSRPGTS